MTLLKLLFSVLKCYAPAKDTQQVKEQIFLQVAVAVATFVAVALAGLWPVFILYFFFVCARRRAFRVMDFNGITVLYIW